ncbi:MAG: hypothetical protein JO001_06720, partial [Alphaproteobacteria bacterium]|nr:hypothetical protein [Alphaproteobacteria bacterium]
EEDVNCEILTAVVTRFDRDRFGNVVSKTVSAFGEPEQRSKSEFDPFGRYSVAETDVFGHRAPIKRSPTTGQPTSATDINGLVTSFTYDGFGRLRQETGPTGISTTTTLVARTALPKIDDNRDFSWGLSAPVSYAVGSQVGTLPATWSLFDAKGRQLRQVTDAYTSDTAARRPVFKETEYDSLGRVTRTSTPHDASESHIRWTTNEYDSLGRVCASTAINGLRSETLFAGRPEGGGTVIVVVDPRQQVVGPPAAGSEQPTLSCGRSFPAGIYRDHGLDQRSSATVNMRKQTIESTDSVGKVTFTYDAGGHVVRNTGPTGAVTVNTYNGLGNKIAVADPDLGLWRYEYDPFGRVVRQTDAKGQVATVEYDLAGRPTHRVAQDVSTSWKYDTARHGVGKVASVTSSNGYIREYSYDTYGRVNGVVVQIDGDQFVSTTELDTYGRVVGVSYPNGFAVRNVYDDKGYFVKVVDAATSKPYWIANGIDIYGRVTDETLGNGVKTARRYDSRDERVRQISTRSASGQRIMDLSLDFDLIGNMRNREEAVEHKKESFEYDDLNRLVALVSVEVGRSEYKYDAAGRFTYKAGTGDYHYAQNSATTGGEFRPFHGVIETTYKKVWSHYRYDLNGNMISTPHGHLDYTADNRVKLIYLDEAKWSRFDYGPSGDRFRKFSRLNGASEETLYVGLYERVIDYALSANADYLHSSRFSGFERLTRSRNYIRSGSGIVAVVETDDTYANTELYSGWYGKISTTEAWYMHADQLGSIVRATDQNGRVRERFWYDPWGARTKREDNRSGRGEVQQIAGSWKRGFTGHEHLDEFSLIHMNGRMYSSDLGMFTSVDVVNQIVADTQSGNGYIYARDNPLRYVDPSGYDFLGIGGAISGLGHAIGDAWHGITHFAGEVGKWFAQNWREVVVVAVVIVVTYFTAGTGTAGAMTLGESILVGAEAGAAAGAAGGFVGAALYGGNLDDDLQAAVKGGVIGGISGGAFAGVGYEFTPNPGGELSTTSRIEWVAAHGVVGGAKSAAEGGNFWQGFIAAAATKATSFGGSFENFAADTARAAVVGGTVSAISGGKFENGAVTGAFSYMFNDYLDKSRTAYPDDRIDTDYPELVLPALLSGAEAIYASGAAAYEVLFAGEEAASIVTPYALEVQSASAEAQAALEAAQSGAPLYRTGQLGQSMAGESQYWSLENPMTPGYANQMGMPNVTPDFVLRGTLNRGASVITNEAPGLGVNAGRGIQIITRPGGVGSLQFTMPP